MAEYVRGQDNREQEHSGHNNNSKNNVRGRMRDVYFDAMNFEQRRQPYGSSDRAESDAYKNAGSPAPGCPRNDV